MSVTSRPSLVIKNISNKTITLLGLIDIKPGKQFDLFDKLDRSQVDDATIIKALEAPWGSLYKESEVFQNIQIITCELSTVNSAVLTAAVEESGTPNTTGDKYTVRKNVTYLDIDGQTQQDLIDNGSGSLIFNYPFSDLDTGEMLSIDIKIHATTSQLVEIDTNFNSSTTFYKDVLRFEDTITFIKTEEEEPIFLDTGDMLKLHSLESELEIISHQDAPETDGIYIRLGGAITPSSAINLPEGLITCISGDRIIQGEYFVLTGYVVSGEIEAFQYNIIFDKTGELEDEEFTRIVQITDEMTADEVKNAVIEALNFNIVPEVFVDDGGPATLLITANIVGDVGNVPITDAVADPGFVVSGLAGGYETVFPPIDIKVIVETEITRILP